MANASKTIKVVIVDDTAFMRKALVEILSRDPEIEIVGIARHGRELLDIIKVTDPDVITLDVDMPVMDGLTTLKHIMVKSPRPVVMISGLADRPAVTFEALRIGAVDFFPKPSGTISLDINESGDQLADLVKQAAFINPYAIKRAGIPIKQKVQLQGNSLEGLITVLAPPGATGHLIRLLANISPDKSCAVIVIQNFSDDVLASYSLKMDELLPWKVKNGDSSSLSPGTCVLASAHNPLTFSNKDTYHEVAPGNSGGGVENMMTELATKFQERLLNVIFGGVDKTGINGIKNIAAQNGTSIALASDKCVYSRLTEASVSKGLAEQVESEQSLWDKVNHFMEKIKG
jgi:two-component system chemotaxis response regulator CheB